jgi:hypothetical protein
MLLDPNAIERVEVALELNTPVVRLNPFNDNEPAIRIVERLPAASVNELPSDQPPPAPLNVSGPILVPFVVTVLPVVVALNVVTPVLFHTVPATNDILPDTISVGEVPVAKVTVPADTVISKQRIAPVRVTVYVPA